MSGSLEYEFLVCLLMAILLLELVARRLQLPPAAAFIVGGVVLALIPRIPSMQIEPDLILLIFLPPLLMNGAYFTDWRAFKENFAGIASLALGAVLFTTLAVGVAAKWLVPALPWAVCFALGAILSPPDAVAANAVLDRLSLPGRMIAVLQGESLVNDASGLVLFRFAVAAALTGSFSAGRAVGSFCLLAVGGLAVGLAIGWLGVIAIRRLRDTDLTITSTLLLAGLSYFSGEWLHVSGVLATVATGLLLGWHQHEIFSAATRVRAQAFWRVLVFLLESLLFILIGLSLRGVLTRVGGLRHGLLELAAPVLGVIAAVVLSRFAWMLGTYLFRSGARLLGRAAHERPSLGTAIVMSWAGMRGVVTLAGALSLPGSFPGRDLVLACAFGVILATVLLQGTTLGLLIRMLRMTSPEEAKRLAHSGDLAWARMTDAQFKTITALSHQADGAERHPRLLEQYRLRARLAAEYLKDKSAHETVKAEHFAAVAAAIRAGRAEALRMHRAGEIRDSVLREIEHELDLQQMVAESHI
jgi:monovalent cation/hydrogen antiporter